MRIFRNIFLTGILACGAAHAFAAPILYHFTGQDSVQGGTGLPVTNIHGEIWFSDTPVVTSTNTPPGFTILSIYPVRGVVVTYADVGGAQARSALYATDVGINSQNQVFWGGAFTPLMFEGGAFDQVDLLANLDLSRWRTVRSFASGCDLNVGVTPYECSAEDTLQDVRFVLTELAPVTSIPEPGTLGLLASGLLLMGFSRGKQRPAR